VFLIPNKPRWAGESKEESAVWGGGRIIQSLVTSSSTGNGGAHPPRALPAAPSRPALGRSGFSILSILIFCQNVHVLRAGLNVQPAFRFSASLRALLRNIFGTC